MRSRGRRLPNDRPGTVARHRADAVIPRAAVMGGTAAGALFRERERRRRRVCSADADGTAGASVPRTQAPPGRKIARDAEPPVRRALRGTSPRGGGERTKTRAAEIRPACAFGRSGRAILQTRTAPRARCSTDASTAAGALFRRRGRHRGRAIPQTRTAPRALFRRRERYTANACSADADTSEHKKTGVTETVTPVFLVCRIAFYFSDG
jgi:hypothetical protein